MLTRKDIDEYQKTSDNEFKNGIEKNVLNSSFESDALDGYIECNANSTALNALDKKFLRKSPWVWVISLTSLILLTTLIPFNYQNRKNSITKSTTPTKTFKIDRHDVLIPERIDTLSILPPKERILTKELIKDFKERNTFEKEIENRSKKEEQQIAPLLVKSLTSETENREPIRVQVLGAEFYLHDLKLLDYRKYRNKNLITTEEILLSGTRADVENPQTFKEEDWESRTIPYVVYLEKTMSWFSKGQLKKALSRFEHILETYPDDLNALFYAGLIQYNLNNAEQAFQLFKKCTENKFQNFNEEATWYCALCCIRQQENFRAIQILDKIQREKGFYAEQATKLLTEMR